jgi:hypothetical protein
VSPQKTILCSEQAKCCQEVLLLWIKPTSRQYNGDILKENGKWEHETCKNVRGLKCARLVWMGKVDAKNRRTTDEAVKEQPKVDECDKF